MNHRTVEALELFLNSRSERPSLLKSEREARACRAVDGDKRTKMTTKNKKVENFECLFSILRASPLFTEKKDGVRFRHRFNKDLPMVAKG